MNNELVLVHECGHIVQPGEFITLVPRDINDDLSPDRFDVRYEFKKIVRPTNYLTEDIRYVHVIPEDTNISEIRDVRRFGCTVHVVSGEETPT